MRIRAEKEQTNKHTNTSDMHSINLNHLLLLFVEDQTFSNLKMT